MHVKDLAIAELVVLLSAAAFGLGALIRWVRRRGTHVPTTTVVTHLTLQTLAILLWLAFVLTETLAVAWTAFVVITVGQAFGDRLMFASYRARHPHAVNPRYLTMGTDVLTFKRRLPGFHVWFGALGWFAMLAICLVATITA